MFTLTNVKSQLLGRVMYKSQQNAVQMHRQQQCIQDETVLGHSPIPVVRQWRWQKLGAETTGMVDSSGAAWQPCGHSLLLHGDKLSTGGKPGFALQNINPLTGNGRSKPIIYHVLHAALQNANPLTGHILYAALQNANPSTGQILHAALQNTNPSTGQILHAALQNTIPFTGHILYAAPQNANPFTGHVPYATLQNINPFTGHILHAALQNTNPLTSHCSVCYTAKY